MMPFMNRRRLLAGSAGLALAPYLPAFAQYAQGVPHSRFGVTSTAEEVTAGIDLSGKTALVTGCNSGIGYETMRVLALRGAHVIGTARTEEKGRVACASVEGRATPVVLELTDFESVVACAQQVAAMNTPVDMLILSAGVLFRDLRQIRSLEMQFVVNHLGHFLLTNHLLEVVLAAPQGRVVTVGSVAHRRAPNGGIQFDNLSGEGWADQGYAHSKLANGLFAFELARRLDGTNATSNCLHPGGVQTNIMRNVGDGSAAFMRKTVAEGAATTCYVATNPALAGVNGVYFSDCKPAEPSAMMQDAAMATRLWEVSEELTREYLG